MCTFHLLVTEFGGAALPDEVLLDIFTFYVKGADEEEEWITLVHVCRGWRYIVFASPLRLDLRLCVRGKTHVREMLDIWPALPIVISPHNGQWISEITENIITALEHHNRVRRISLLYFPVPGWGLERFLEMMQHPFPALTHLDLWDWFDKGEGAAVIPDSFLGGSAPLLESLELTGVAFPALPKLLLSANHLIRLDLRDIAHAGYISPEVMVTSLSSVAQLRYFGLTFDSPHSRPSSSSRRPPPMLRTTLPTLTHFSFQGVSEYVEDFMARVDAPLLRDVNISFFNQLIFDIPQLSQFINHVEKFNGLNAKVSFSKDSASVELSSETDHRLLLGISCNQADWQLSSVAQLCGLSSYPISTSESLTVTINSGDAQHFGQFDIDPSQWVELLHLFTNVENLYLAEDVGLHTVTALQGLVGESVTQMLPALQRLFLEGLQPRGSTWEAAVSFVAARQRLGCPTVIHRWEEERESEDGFDESEQEPDSEWESDEAED